MDAIGLSSSPAPALPTSNTTHANITGKVPKTALRGRTRGGKRKAAKLSSDQRSHAKHLQKAGQISPKAAASHGLKP
jgi:hypothetical protein